MTFAAFAAGLSTLLAGSALAAALAPQTARAAVADCASLKTLSLPAATVEDAAVLPQFPLQADVDPKGPPPVKQPFCRVRITARPTRDSDIKIELWIPETGAWNGRFLQVGNGGFAGEIPYRSLMAGLAKGYATAGTDDGHEHPKDGDSTDAAWAVGHPEKIVDFGYRALKETTDLSKTVLAAYVGAPKFSYFNGCSDGGREALMEVQRYPADFDGVVAGDPANDWTHLQGFGVQGVQTLLRLKDGFLTHAKLAALQAAAVRQCGDEDGVVENPLVCHFDPGVIACRSAETDSCLTKDQLIVARAIYGGRRDKSGRLAFPGLEPGGEGEKNGWERWVIGDEPSGGDASLALKFNSNFFGNLVYQDPKYDIMRFNYERDMPAVDARFARILNSVDPDLSAFKAHGGKLIQYHGWADPAIPARTSIDYFEAVQSKMGDTQAFYRLFMVPGMLHCGGGPGATAFDMQAAISAWVEAGAAPARVVAAKFVDGDPSKGVLRTRVLCPFPQTAVYDGKGDRAKASSFVCTAPASMR